MTRNNTDAAVLDAARLLLQSHNLTPQDLLDASTGVAKARPTFGTYVPQVCAALPEGGTRAMYSSYLNKLLRQPGWAEREIDDPTVTELEAIVQLFRATRRIRKNDRGGRSTVENAVGALRFLYRHAENDGHIRAGTSPAAKLKKPRHQASNRRALPDTLLLEINTVAGNTGRDPALDTLLLRLHTETACRRCGAIALRPMDLDPIQCVIRLREKGGTERWQPVSRTLMDALIHHHRTRGGAPDEQLLRYRNGKPMGYTHYDRMWQRLRRYIPQAETHRLSIHWLRHTTLTWVERNFGKAVAKEYAGHAPGSGSVTDIYTRATIFEVAAAVAALTNEPHPLVAKAANGFVPSDAYEGVLVDALP